MLDIATLPIDHPLRNAPLAAIQAGYIFHGETKFRPVGERWKIAKSTYNQLGTAWTKRAEWRANMTPKTPLKILPP